LRRICENVKMYGEENSKKYLTKTTKENILRRIICENVKKQMYQEENSKKYPTKTTRKQTRKKSNDARECVTCVMKKFLTVAYSGFFICQQGFFNQ